MHDQTRKEYFQSDSPYKVGAFEDIVASYQASVKSNRVLDKLGG